MYGQEKSDQISATAFMNSRPIVLKRLLKFAKNGIATASLIE